MQPVAGDFVENFNLPDQDGNSTNLTDFAGKPVVLFFYPKADTPGCTIEACGFRDQFAKLQKAGAVVLGISRDTVKAQKNSNSSTICRTHYWQTQIKQSASVSM